jgi:hypothetical protein
LSGTLRSCPAEALAARDSKLSWRSRQPFGQPVPIGDMDREGLLQNLQQSLGHRRVLVGSLQRRDGLTLTVEADLSALNAQLGILYKMFQGRAGHAEA